MSNATSTISSSRSRLLKLAICACNARPALCTCLWLSTGTSHRCMAFEKAAAYVICMSIIASLDGELPKAWTQQTLSTCDTKLHTSICQPRADVAATNACVACRIHPCPLGAVLAIHACERCPSPPLVGTAPVARGVGGLRCKSADRAWRARDSGTTRRCEVARQTVFAGTTSACSGICARIASPAAGANCFIGATCREAGWMLCAAGKEHSAVANGATCRWMLYFNRYRRIWKKACIEDCLISALTSQCTPWINEVVGSQIRANQEIISTHVATMPIANMNVHWIIRIVRAYINNKLNLEKTRCLVFPVHASKLIVPKYMGAPNPRNKYAEDCERQCSLAVDPNVDCALSCAASSRIQGPIGYSKIKV